MRFVILLVTLLLTGCASYKVGPADLGQGLDAMTTAAAIYGAGATESNVLLAGVVNEPAGMAAVVAVKAALVAFGKMLSPGECRMVSGALFSIGAAAGINNLLVILGVATPGAAVVAPGAGLLWWLYEHFNLWKNDC